MKKFLKIFALSLLATVILLTGGAMVYLRNADDTHDLQLKVDRMCEKLVENKKATGLVVGVIRGDQYYMAGYGSSGLGSKPDSNTIFEIGSISKVFTAELTQMLVDKNLLHWDDNIYSFLPPEAVPAARDSTTLLNLASHTSGYPSVPEYLLGKITDECDPYSSMQLQDVYTYLKNSKDKKQPDIGHYDYSNLGAGLLGHILEFRTGKKYEALLQEHICGPLGMRSTSLLVSDSMRFACGFDEQGKKTCHWHFPVIYACGGIRSTLSDMMQFLAANLDDKSPSGASFARTHRAVAKTSMGKVACGWHIDHISGALAGIDEIIWHNGGTGGFSTIMAFDKKHHTGVVVLANQSTRTAVDELGFKIVMRAAGTSLR